MKSQVLHTVWCNISGEVAGEIWYWSLLGVEGLSFLSLVAHDMTIKIRLKSQAKHKCDVERSQGLLYKLGPFPASYNWFIISSLRKKNYISTSLVSAWPTHSGLCIRSFAWIRCKPLPFPSNQLELFSLCLFFFLVFFRFLKNLLGLRSKTTKKSSVKSTGLLLSPRVTGNPIWKGGGCSSGMFVLAPNRYHERRG